jgi:hydroxyacylglutathione hydrolase
MPATIQEIRAILIPPDNYAYLIVTTGGAAAVVDPSSAGPVLDILKSSGLRLKCIFCTHFHSDHTGGNRELKRETGCTVIAPDKRTAQVDIVADAATDLSGFIAGLKLLAVPGHTRTAAAYYHPDSGIVFTGDTLFTAGCGRLFECGPETLFASLQRLASLPETTQVYCGHEYTLENLQFALTVEPGNGDIQARLHDVQERLRSDAPVMPGTIGQEQRTNPFLRTNSPLIRKSLGMEGRSPVAVFAELRRRKDRF